MTERVNAFPQDEPEGIRRLTLDGVFPHVFARCGGGDPQEVDVLRPAGLGVVNERRPDAADASHERIDDALCDGAGDRGGASCGGAG